MASKLAFGAQPSPANGWDKLGLISAAIADAGSALGGGQGGATQAFQQGIIGRQQYAKQQAALQGLGQLGFGAQGRGQGGVNLNDPATQNALQTAILAGVPGADKLVSLYSAAKPTIKIGPDGNPYNENDPSVLTKRFGNPTNVNNQVLDLNDPKNLGAYVPNAPANGAIPTMGADGRINGFNMPQSSSNAIAASEAAKAAGQAIGGAPYTPDNRTNAQGAPVYGVVADRFGQGGGGLVGQSPEANTAATTDARLKAEAGANAQLGMSQTVQQAQQSLNLIDQIRNHPALGARTGMLALAPAIPGTAGADFDAMTAQLKGKVFLTAYTDLKGAGAITEQEGKVATAAIARLNQAQSKDGYLKALSDLEDVIKKGVGRAQQKAGGGTAAPPRSAIEAELRRRGLLK